MVGMQNGTDTFKDCLAVSYKTRPLHAPRYLPNELKTWPHKNLYSDVFESLFIIAKTWGRN